MDKQLKEELMAFFVNFERTMSAYRFSLTSKQYIDPVSHMTNIEQMNILCSKLKAKVEKL